MSVIRFKEANCKNCYKCIRSCPVKAIAFNNEQAAIVNDDCILCGKCLTVCPQNAKSVCSDIDKVKAFITKNEKVYVSLAPSFISAFEWSDMGTMTAILKKLGFMYVEETAVGAAKVSAEYAHLLEQHSMENIITTACPTTVYLIEKYYPSLIPMLAPVVSPMIAHAKMMREMYGKRIRIVFIGPCISKKEECNDLQNSGAVDAVLTFEELENWLDMEGITPETIDENDAKGIRNVMARFYPAPGGIIKTIDPQQRKHYKSISVDGVDRCMEILESLKSGEAGGYFIEMNACAGGCLGGPCIKRPKGGFLQARETLMGYVRKMSRSNGYGVIEDAEPALAKTYIDRSKKVEVPGEDVIRAILAKIGKYSSDKELNCGACGYSTCREKAIAVYNGKADLKMCLPFMRERAESISNIIIHSTPNAILALNDDLVIQEYNEAARRLFRLDNADMCGRSVFEVLECPDFEQVRETGVSIIDSKYFYEKYDITTEQSILYIKENKVIVAIIKDITGEELHKQQMFKVRSETVDIAQKVIDKQMRVAQEIASLLGETTAETKLALTRLKKTIQEDMGEGIK